MSWKKRTQSLSYIFKEETSKVFADGNIDSMFAIDEQNIHRSLKNI